MKNKYQKKSHISEVQFQRGLKCFSVDIPATSAAVLAGFNRKNAQHIHSLLRDRVVKVAIREARPFVGDIEVYECYFGAKRICGQRGREVGGKTPVLGLRKRHDRKHVTIIQGFYFYQSLKSGLSEAAISLPMVGKSTTDW